MVQRCSGARCRKDSEMRPYTVASGGPIGEHRVLERGHRIRALWFLSHSIRFGLRSLWKTRAPG